MAVGRGQEDLLLPKTDPDGAGLAERFEGVGATHFGFRPNPPPEWMDSFACPTLRFSPQPLKMEEVATQCDLAVGDGTHGMVLQMLNAGKPMLLGRSHIENTLNARKVMEAGAGLACPPPDAGKSDRSWRGVDPPVGRTPLERSCGGGWGAPSGPQAFRLPGAGS